MNLRTLRSLGFDLSQRADKGIYRVRCSQCVPMVINSVPTHETGCPNAMHECKGCNAMLTAQQGRYCADCA
jgi:hypothetical protein